MKTYYSLITRFDQFDFWAVQFGDYDLETVQDELQEYTGGCYAADIIATADSQAAINSRVTELNLNLDV